MPPERQPISDRSPDRVAGVRAQPSRRIDIMRSGLTGCADRRRNREGFGSNGRLRRAKERWEENYDLHAPAPLSSLTNLIGGAVRPQTPHRSPRQAFGGNFG